MKQLVLSYSAVKIQFSYRITGLAIMLVIIAMAFSACSSRKQKKLASMTPEIINIHLGDGSMLEIEFTMGTGHNHPLMAIWTEDGEGNYIETVFVAASIGTGVFGHAQISNGNWEPGPVKRPAAIPYWWHRYGSLPSVENPVPDAITGPTPKGNFIIRAQLPANYPEKFNVLMEINQSWDWNEYWNNTLYPENKEYMTSSQPAVVYAVMVDRAQDEKEYTMKLIGHSHYAGENGLLYDDTSTLSTAKEIAARIVVRMPE